MVNELSEFARQMGKKGGAKVKRKYGKDYYSRIGKLGGRPRKEKETKKIK